MRIVFLTLFSVFHLVMKHCVSRLMYYVTIKHLFIKTREAPHFRQYYCIFSFQLEIVERTYENKTVPFDFWNEKENNASVQTKSMILSFSFASADKCASLSNYQLNYLPQWAEILTQRSNLTPPRASEKYFDLHVVPKLQSWFASYLSSLLFRDQQTRVQMQFTPNRSIFTWLFTVAECTEKSPWRRI